MSWLSFLEPVVALVKDPIMEYQKRKTLKAELEAKLLEKQAETKMKMMDYQVELAKQGMKIEADWDLNAQKQMENTWKDEYLLFLLTLPIIGSFIPQIQDYVVVGWGYIAKAPEWYIFSFLGIVAATFGLRWLIKPLITKMSGGAIK